MAKIRLENLYKSGGINAIALLQQPTYPQPNAQPAQTPQIPMPPKELPVPTNTLAVAAPKKKNAKNQNLSNKTGIILNSHNII